MPIVTLKGPLKISTVGTWEASLVGQDWEWLKIGSVVLYGFWAGGNGHDGRWEDWCEQRLGGHSYSERKAFPLACHKVDSISALVAMYKRIFPQSLSLTLPALSTVGVTLLLPNGVAVHHKHLQDCCSVLLRSTHEHRLGLLDLCR